MVGSGGVSDPLLRYASQGREPAGIETEPPSAYHPRSWDLIWPDDM